MATEEFDLDELNVQSDDAVDSMDEKELNTLKQVQEALSGCSLHFNWYGIIRSVPKNVNVTAASSINANPRNFKGKAELIDTTMKEWKDLQSIRTAIKASYEYRTFKYVIAGQRLFRREMKEEIWGLVNEAKASISQAAYLLQSKRGTIIAWAKENLGEAFDLSQYPDDFRTKFGVTIREHSIEPPSYLRHTNAEEYKQTLKRQLADIQSSMQSFERDCMRQVGESIGKMVTALTGDGSVRQSTLSNMQATFSRIATMRFEGTAAFKAAMEEAKKTINSVSIVDLRHSHGCRENTKEKLNKLLDRYKELKESSAKKAVDPLS